MTGLFPDSAPQFSREQKREAILREITFRERVYERRVAEGKMSQKFADEQIAIFEAIAEDYEDEG